MKPGCSLKALQNKSCSSCWEEAARLVQCSRYGGRVAGLPVTFRLGSSTNFNANDAGAATSRGERVLDLIEQARDSVVKAGPVLPSDESVRDHVWAAIETSIQRLRGAVATLPEVQLRTPLSGKLEELLKVVQDVRGRRRLSSLATARATVNTSSPIYQEHSMG